MTDAGRLFVVRHGESVWNVEGRHQGQLPAAPGLTDLGRSHALAVAETLAASRAAVVLSSDLRRAVETAMPIAAALEVPLRLEPRLRERCFGVLEGQFIADSGVGDIGVTGDLVTDPDAAPPGGESIRQLYDRIIGLLRELRDGPVTRMVLVSHGGPMRVIRGYLAGTAIEAMSWSAVANGAVLEVPLPPAAS